MDQDEPLIVGFAETPYTIDERAQRLRPRRRRACAAVGVDRARQRRHRWARRLRVDDRGRQSVLVGLLGRCAWARARFLPGDGSRRRIVHRRGGTRRARGPRRCSAGVWSSSRPMPPPRPTVRIRAVIGRNGRIRSVSWGRPARSAAVVALRSPVRPGAGCARQACRHPARACAAQRQRLCQAAQAVDGRRVPGGAPDFHADQPARLRHELRRRQCGAGDVAAACRRAGARAVRIRGFGERTNHDIANPVPDITRCGHAVAGEKALRQSGLARRRHRDAAAV